MFLNFWKILIELADFIARNKLLVHFQELVFAASQPNAGLKPAGVFFGGNNVFLYIIWLNLVVFVRFS